MADHLNKIVVSELLRNKTIDELNAAADEYFKHATKNALLQKPFNDINEASEVVLTLINVLKGLRVRPGATILDFGAGSCWSSQILAGFGYKVIACDVSKTALSLGRELLERRPIFVPHPPVTFLLFDGHRIDLPTHSVDAICCLSAFHHVPNQKTVLGELARVLKPWGRVGFSEPGPKHSMSDSAQWEMKRYDVVENDIVIEDIVLTGQEFGFTDVQLCIFQPNPQFMGLHDFNQFLAGRSNPTFETMTRSLMQERRLFILGKFPTDVTTSNVPTGLDGRIEPAIDRIEAHPGELLELSVNVVNTGTSLWRPSDDHQGPVRLGYGWTTPHPDTKCEHRAHLSISPQYMIYPGETAQCKVSIPAPTSVGRHLLRLRLVAEWVAWFGPEVELPVIII